MNQAADRPPGLNASPINPHRPRWIVLVAASQADLYQHLRHAFRADRQVEVMLDRRSNPRRNPPWVIERLRTHGAAVIRRDA
jgi:hypothetical protein